VSVDSCVEEVYRRRTSITSHKIDHNFGVVEHPTRGFLWCPTPRHHSGVVFVEFMESN